MKVFLILVGCWTLMAVTDANPMAARYDDFKVYRVEIKDEQQLKEFKKLAENLPLRMLHEIGGPNQISDIVIDPDNQHRFEKELRFLDIDFNCIIQDLQSIIEEAQPRSHYGLARTEMNWEHYQSLPVIYNWLDKLAAENPDLITPFIIGFSYENRPIKAIKISTKPGNKAIFIEANIHAIEWISSATATCLINILVNSSDKNNTFLLENYDWIIVPVLNPDGFVYSHDENRLWRKNRKPTDFHNASGPCIGTDLNRNFGFEWGVNAYNYDVPCDHWYAGAASDTEPEVICLENFLNSFEDGYICMSLALHSYGNFVLLPYGHTIDEYPENYDQMMRICSSFADAAEEIYGTKFKCGASGVINYPVSGSSKDWQYGVKKIPFTATLELRDNGTYGFFLPSSQISEVCHEVFHGLKAMVRRAKKEGLFD